MTDIYRKFNTQVVKFKPNNMVGGCYSCPKLLGCAGSERECRPEQYIHCKSCYVGFLVPHQGQHSVVLLVKLFGIVVEYVAKAILR